MSWATRTTTMEPEPRAMPAEMLQEVQVRAIRGFVFEDLEAIADEVLYVPRHRAEYLRFRQLVEYEHTQ